MVIFRFVGQNGLKLELRSRTQNTYGTLKERYQVNLQEKKLELRTFAVHKILMEH